MKAEVDRDRGTSAEQTDRPGMGPGSETNRMLWPSNGSGPAAEHEHLQGHVGACNQAMKEREVQSLQPHSLSQGTQPCPCPLPESTNATGNGPGIPQPVEAPQPAMCSRG